MWSRIATLLKISISDLLLEADDPQEAAAPLLAEMESGLAQAKDAVAAAVVKEHQLEQQLVKAHALSAEWDAKTDTALHSGDDDAARHALKRKIAYERRASEVQAALEQQRETVAEMRDGLKALQEKVEDIRHQRDELIAHRKRGNKL